jgi:hypothetical protein
MYRYSPSDCGQPSRTTTRGQMSAELSLSQARNEREALQRSDRNPRYTRLLLDSLSIRE